jgi:hypothetical protein
VSQAFSSCARRRERFFQAGEVRDHAVQAGYGEDPQDGRAGGDQPYFTAAGFGPLVRRHQRVNAGRVTELGPAHVDHQPPGPVHGRLKQRGPQPVGIGDIDLFGRHHHRHAVDHLDREPGLRHPRPSPSRRGAGS